MDLESLKTFLTLSKLKNFTQTANKHFIVQSTVTNRIMELEKELGKKLFIRDKKSVKLTEAGKHLIPYAKRMVEIESALTKDLNLLNSYSDLIKIGSTNTIYDCYLEPILSNFIKKHPHIAVKVLVDHSSTLFQMLQDGTVDIIFTYLPFHHNGYHCISFKHDSLTLVTSPIHTEFTSGILKENLPSIPCLYCDFVFEEGYSFVRDLFPSHHTFPFEIDRSTKLIHYLLEGIGYSFLPKSLITPYLDHQQLIEIPLLDFDTPIIESYIVSKNHYLETLTGRSFYNML